MKRFEISRGAHAGLIAASLAVMLLAAGNPAHALQPDRDGPQNRSGPRGREVSDQEHARYQRESGQNRSFEELYRRASSIGRGEYLGVEPDISRNIYRFKFMRPSGNVVWVDMDGRTGRELAVRQ